MSNRVVLPHPDGPMSAKISPVTGLYELDLIYEFSVRDHTCIDLSTHI